MGKIGVLSFAVANLIAAGEVVDRPASVIKELLENSIDSGATRITVEIQNGGVTYMRVADNGCGMEASDLPIAVRRHATSKIRDASDLDAIMTLGFRGEALAAIASVSKLRIISKPHDAELGAELSASGGDNVTLTERGCSAGTSVIVEDLFYNVPARRKFLKKDVTEAMAVSAAVEKIALSRPDIAFSFISDGLLKLETAGDGQLKNAVYAIFGREFSSKLIEIDSELDGIKINGFIGRSDNVRGNRNYQNFFINGRYIKSKTAMAALEQAFCSYIPPEKYPCCVINIGINPAKVDVNVHPAKLEVKFSNEKPVFEAVYYAVKSALEGNVTRPEVTLAPTRPTAAPQQSTPAPRGAGESGRFVSQAFAPVANSREESLGRRQLSYDMTKAAPTGQGQPTHSEKFERISAEEYLQKYVGLSTPPERTPRSAPSIPAQPPTPKAMPNVPDAARENVRIEMPTPIPTPAPSSPERKVEEKPDSVVPEPNVALSAREGIEYRIVGEVFNSYILVEKGDTMLLIDKHAAHERIIFETLKASMQSAERTSQMLMIPIEVMMTSSEVDIISEYRTEIEAIGFDFETMKNTVSISAIPSGIASAAVPDMIYVIADRIKNGTGDARLTHDIIFEKALYQASCKAAIKAGREYASGHIDWIVEQLMQYPDITFCPHGRPIAMEMSHRTIDRQFGRT